MKTSPIKHPIKTIPGREPLRWLVVNPEGKLLAILDSESEAYRFARPTGSHAYSSVTVRSEIDYAQAPELLAALELLMSDPSRKGLLPETVLAARAAIAKATGR